MENKVNELVSEFWTNQNEMEESIESLGLYVAEINGEYVTVAEENSDMSAILYLGRANETMWVERIVFVDENGFDVEDDNEEEEEW
jgi:hypothetical protein